MDRDHNEHYILIFFVAYQMSLGRESFWDPYFEISADSDLPMNWPPKDLNLLHDEVLKMSVCEQKEEIQEEYEEALEIASQYPDLIDLSAFTLKNFHRAYSLIMTRAFGWSLPYMMLVPFADNCNHMCVENYFELFNSRLSKRMLANDQNFNNHEKQYFTRNKSKIQFLKHFQEDGDLDTKIYYSTNAYYKRLKQRDEVLAISPGHFVKDKKFKKMNVWDLKYISTSDDDDNDSDVAESSEEEDEEEEQPKDESKADIFKKHVEGQGDRVPDIVKGLTQNTSNKERVRYQYTYATENGEVVGEEPKKSVVIKKKSERKGPNDLIELLTREKDQMWNREQRMKVLKEQDEAEWQKLIEEFNSSDSDDEEEDFAWYDMEDKDTYFVLTTLNKIVYLKDTQVFHCYGRRSNQYLVGNYGFCLPKNKYNSLRFKVNLDFSWRQRQSGERKDEEMVCSKMITLKENRLKDEVFSYIRANLIKNQKNEDEKKGSHLLLSSPVDLQFELLVVGCTINLLEGLRKTKFKTSIEQDKDFLTMPGISQRKATAIMHRIGQQQILQNNLTLLNILLRILARLKSEPDKEYKVSYMERVEGFETEAEVMPNRLKLRRYLKEFLLNQQRIVKAASEIELQPKHYLEALELKISDSSTPYFSNKHQPS